MNKRMAITTLGLCLASPLASAQFVKGNEAVTIDAGHVLITTPPPPARLRKPCAANAACHAGAWRMVETDAGLMECTEPWARPGSCRASTYGADKLRRVWVVKRQGQWLQCQYPQLTSRCAPLFARPPANLPLDALQ